MTTRGGAKRGAPPISRSNIKRTKEDDADELDDEPDIDDIEEFSNEEDEVIGTIPLLLIQEDASYPQEWKRPDSTVSTKDEFTFQQFEIDVSYGKPHPTMAKGTDPNEAPHIRLFGLTKEGFSVLTHVHGFMPYLYTDCPPIPAAKQVCTLVSIQYTTNSTWIFQPRVFGMRPISTNTLYRIQLFT